jgi:predicted dehydrogenase
MSQKVKVGIIGLGFMGTTHFDIYKSNDKAEIVAVADVNPAKLKGDISSVIGNISGQSNDKLDLTGIAAYGDAMELINDPNVDLVDICVPTFLHKKFAVAALEAGKHVMLEKPVARNKAEAEEIIAAAEKSDKCFTVGMCVRAWPEYRYVYEQYKAGKFGTMKNAFFKRFSPSVAGNAWEDWFMDDERSGGALLDLHLHDTDEVLYFFGKPKAVTTTGSKGFRSPDAYDHVFTFYDYGDDNMVVAEGGWSGAKNAPFEMSFQLICDKATVIFNHAGLNIYYEDGSVESPKLDTGNLPTGWHQEIDNMLNSIMNGAPAEKYLSKQDILDAISIADAERQSVDSKQQIEVNY